LIGSFPCTYLKTLSIFSFEVNLAIKKHPVNVSRVSNIYGAVHQGDRLFKEILFDENNNYRAIENVAKKYIDPNMTFGELMTNFRLALLLKEPTGLYGFKGDPFFDQLKEKIYTGGPTYLRGGAAVVKTVDSENGIQIPSDKGPNITYTFVEKNQVEPGDTQAPDSPYVGWVSNTDSKIVGVTEPNTKVFAMVGSSEIGRTMSDQIGDFTIQIPLQPAGTVIDVYAEDASGNVSEPATIHVIDVVPPQAPSVNQVFVQDTVVTGQTEPGVTIEVSIYQEVIGSGKASEDGSFLVEIPAQPIGTPLYVTAIDDYGNISYATLVIVKDSTVPNAPIVNEVTDQDTAITGHAEPNSMITVKANGILLTNGTADTNGSFSIPIPTIIAGTTITVTATDKAGNESNPTTIIVKDVTPPEKPIVNDVTDKDSFISGQAEGGANIEVKVNGAVIGNDVSNPYGLFSFPIQVQQAGTTLTVTATDASGNVSEATTVVVKDATAPTKPAVHEVTDQDTAVTGKAEAGATIEVKAGSKLLGSGEAKADGTFSITISKQVAGTNLTITATDASGNRSENATITVKQVKKSGWSYENNKWYFYDLTTGDLKKGWLNDGGTWYYFNHQGIMQTGWVQDGAVWYYFTSSGAMKTGWSQIGSTWYYFAGSGAMKTGWVYDGGSWYYMKASGAMSAGWVQVGSSWYYFANSGVMKTGWVYDGRSWYYMKSSGAMATGWAKVGSSWYYFASSGVMKTGWLLEGRTWYYMDAGGAMRTGWVLIGGKWYYFNASGVWVS
ncbi:hypothetical protein DZB84_21415, partial [Bacillus sp. HNG]|uniref:Ig-like domain-containing protein n=1 Tax=Bacillus sp. HNG TaxID=2293325 RepID=UPI000E3988A2